ncbi:MAG: hypothetical protein ACOX5R_17875 [bacterium]|jgi:predicted nucleic acid-binding Zn ribbon protein
MLKITCPYCRKRIPINAIRCPECRTLLPHECGEQERRRLFIWGILGVTIFLLLLFTLLIFLIL